MSAVRTRRGLLALAALVISASSITGCVAEEPTGPRPITEEEADRISEVLYTAFQDGGASFVLSSLMTDGSTIELSGDIDFAGHAGLGELRSTGPDQKVTGIAWYNDTVLEYIPDLLTLAENEGHAPFLWVARTADPTNYPVDAQLAILRALSSDVRENPQLLRQNGVTWLRDDTLDGADVEVFQYGDRTKFWVKKGTTRLLRFEGNNSTGNSPIIIDFTEPGTRTIDLPTLAETVAIQDIADLYERARAVG